MRSRRGAGLAALLAVSALAGCGFSTTGLAFVTDDRVRIVSPRDRAELRLPVTVRWEVDDFEVTGPAQGYGDNEGYFAVFVDRAPMPPGEAPRWVARNDRTCRADDGCPDEQYLAARGVYTTTETQITLETLRNTAREGRREFHEVTVVLLDRNSRRIGEGAWRVRFEIDRTVSQ